QHNLLEHYCDINGFGCVRLDDSVGGSIRQNAMNRFSQSYAKSLIFMLNAKAGDVGINLITTHTQSSRQRLEHTSVVSFAWNSKGRQNNRGTMVVNVPAE
ncbi:hypothetical protein L914_14220, partial [Phytophthora nicotianae]